MLCNESERMFGRQLAELGLVESQLASWRGGGRRERKSGMEKIICGEREWGR
jgi:hypothetical protein